MLNADKLVVGGKLQPRDNAKISREITGFRPAEGPRPRQWEVNGNWLSLAHIDARYRLPGQKKKAGHPLPSAPSGSSDHK